MNGAVREKLKAALTSGEYEQGRNRLRDSDNRYCCLGVLCDLYLKETGNGNWVGLLTSYVFDNGDGDSSATYLPKGVRKWAELDTVGPSTSYHQLVRVNDRGMPFNEIAVLLDDL